MKRPMFRSIRPKDCKCVPEQICFVCRSEQSGCASRTGPAYLHTWIEAVRINNKKSKGRKNR